ncbi:hypothetical protein B484DRAFT_61169 [Ochromonadaceae sp. CCMP2298]|nr:hypothetical protein B484DRAFT_61169 [Ochromonadaceae sp. CCMP2298]
MGQGMGQSMGQRQQGVGRGQGMGMGEGMGMGMGVGVGMGRYRGAQYRPWRLSSHAQWRPLRALSLADQEAVEQQPERVIFAEDLRPLLHLFHPIGAFGGQFSALQRLVVRSLQGLGLDFPGAEGSSSLMSRAAAPLTCVDSGTQLCGRDDVLLYALLWGGQGGQGGVLHPARLAAAAAQSMCTPRAHLLHSHLLCVLCRVPSLLDCVLSVCLEVLRRGGGAGGGGGGGAGGGGVVAPVMDERYLSGRFLSQLRCVVVELLVHRYGAETSISHSTNNNSNSNSSLADVASASTSPPPTCAAGLQGLRDHCRALIAGTVAASAPTSPTYASASASALGDLCVWSTYIEAEAGMGQGGEAIRVADRLLKAIHSGGGGGGAGSGGGGGDAQSPLVPPLVRPLVPGLLQLTWTAMKLAVGCFWWW